MKHLISASLEPRSAKVRQRSPDGDLHGHERVQLPEWCGRFYPEALPAAQMLRYYATRLATVEINNTFYRMPNRDTVAAWRDDVPDSFCFAVKASRRITHQKKLSNVSDDVAHLFEVVDVLGAKARPGAVPNAALLEEGSGAAA